MSEAIAALEDGMRQCAQGQAIRRPRIDNFLPTHRAEEYFCFSSMEGGIREPGYYALRIKPEIVLFPPGGSSRRLKYSSRMGLWGGLIFLYSVDNAELLAILNDGYVQHVRVAATGALGMKYLSAPNSRVMGIIGSGGMARTFALAAKETRPIERIQVFSPNREKLLTYCAEMGEKLSCEIIPASSAEDACHDADIVSCCTNSMVPVLKAEWLKPGSHVSHVAAWELGDDVYDRIGVVGQLVRRTALSVQGFVDDDFALRMDNVMSYAGGTPAERERLSPARSRADWYPNATLVDCVDWDTGTPYRVENPDAIATLAHMTYGVVGGDTASSAALQGIQFATTAGKLYERAVAQGIGQMLPTEMFLQDIPT